MYAWIVNKNHIALKHLMKICERINDKFPSRIQKENWKWRTPFVSERIRFNENTTKGDIINALEKCYAQAKSFEQRLLAESEYIIG